jgi:hypothetical protein
MNPQVLARSESETEKKFGFGFRHSCKIKKFVKNRRSNTTKGAKRPIFLLENFCSVVQDPEHTYVYESKARHSTI